MLRVRYVLPLLALAGLLVAPFLWPGGDAPTLTTASAGRILDNDAGSGGDAGGSPAAALAIHARSRPWLGNLTPPGSDADWYVLADAPEAACAEGQIKSAVPVRFALTADADRTAEVARTTSPSKTSPLVLAVAAGGQPFLGIEPPPSSAMSISDGGATETKPGPGRYTFTFTAHGSDALDPEGDGEDVDGGAVPAASVAMPAPCFVGRVGGADAADHFHVDVPLDARLLLSLADGDGAPVRADLLAPSGAVRATLASGEVARVYADEPGRWVVAVRPQEAPAALARLVADAVPGDGGTYFLALASDDPGSTSPCRPTCAGAT